MDNIGTLVPYISAGGLLLTVSVLRGWHAFDHNVDRALAIALICFAASIAGSVDLGTDAEGYRDYYEQLAITPDPFLWWEPGFKALAMAFSASGAPYGLFVAVCVLVSHAIKLYVFDRIAPNRLLAFAVLFCLNLGEIAFIRQYLAASLVLLSFFLLTRERVVWSVVTLLIAASIHKTAVVPGAIVFWLHFGRSIFKPVALFALGAAVLLAVIPASILQSIEERIYAQMAAYTAEGFIQGLQDENTSLLRNFAKYALYVLLAGWMVLLPARDAAQLIQRRAAYVVFVLSALSVVLIALISPVFARLSTYVFPFLALSVRAERFRPSYTELGGQYLTASLLLANLFISTYPLIEYL